MTNTSYQRRTARNNINRYNYSTDYRLEDVYGRYSSAKARAWNYCVELMKKYNGYGLKVLSSNTFMFTAGFLFEDKETGAVQFMFITPSYDCVVDY